MTKVIITGSKGRMGAALINCARRIPNVQVTGAVDQGDDLAAVLFAGEVVIDFSFHSATPEIVELCARHKKPVVIGTTGLSTEEQARVRACQTVIPMVWSSNYSTGVNTLFWLTRQSAQILGPSYDLEIVEMHHRQKKDAPSGTASTLAEILAETRRAQAADLLRHGRHGIVGARTSEEIGMHSLRGGDVVGDHTVIFAAEGERVELTHKASSRDTFANGALRAAQWVLGRPPGIYSMQDVLGLSPSPNP